MITAEYLHEFFHKCAADRIDPKVAAIGEILKNPLKGIVLQRLLAALANDGEIVQEE